MKKHSEESFLLRRYVDNLYTTEDARKLLKTIHAPECEEVLDGLTSDVWEESEAQTLLTGVEHERYKKEARQLLKRIEHKKRFYFRRIAVAVASMAAMFCLVWGGVKYVDYLKVQQVVWKIVSTTYGEKKNIVLPDGTMLVLNSCSKVRYPIRFVSDERKVELEGEGYFQVARNEEQPFIVSTSRFDVRVLGTSFNIKSYKADELVSVDVESGKVQVDLPEAMMRLRAKEKMLFNTHTGNYNKSSMEQKIALWRKGILCFNQTPIRDVAKELERIYQCRITFADGQSFDNLITGEHENPNLESVLRSIQYASSIYYKRNGNSILLYK
ncbi:MAG: FecR domain-containing protein [Bacteroidaceae bacterium]|nr:FecR domain-containing protein [Bacteroides sp.]MBQ8242849.1 FecR domain-containing protein [Bacteroidaceae bacterium]MBQ8601221.1 FecR domain-containing protein [Bacteroides sp.]